MLLLHSRILAKAMHCDFFIDIYFLPIHLCTWKETKIYKSEYRAGNITQWFCRAIKQCIISVKNCAAIMVKVAFEIKSSLNKIKNFFTGRPGDFFFVMGW